MQKAGASVSAAPRHATASGLESIVRPHLKAFNMGRWREMMAQIEGRVCRLEHVIVREDQIRPDHETRSHRVVLITLERTIRPGGRMPLRLQGLDVGGRSGSARCRLVRRLRGGGRRATKISVLNLLGPSGRGLALFVADNAGFAVATAARRCRDSPDKGQRKANRKLKGS